MKTALLTIYPITLCLEIVLLIFAFALGKNPFQEKENAPFSVKRYFPHELISGKKATPARVCLYLNVGFSLWNGTVLLLLLLDSTFSYLTLLCTLANVANFLRIAAFFALTVVPSNETKPHLAIFCVYGCLSVIYFLLGGFTLMNLAKVTEFANLVLPTNFIYALMVVLFLLCVVSVLLFCSKKLAHWYELDTEMDKSGVIVAKRPKVFILALYEWLFLFFGIAANFALLFGAILGISNI
ncbi:MAG: hypothetical protein HUJ60_03710 [Bacilli bacterium]|nr:hypothetical protein [Bacilli bacterium]